MIRKNVSLRLEAYLRLTNAKRRPDESFSDVVMRANWPDCAATVSEWLSLRRNTGPVFEREGLDRIETLKKLDQSPDCKADHAP